MTRGTHEIFFELCVKNGFVLKNKQNNLLFPSNLDFFWCSRAALDTLAGRMFETPVLKHWFLTEGPLRGPLGST